MQHPLADRLEPSLGQLSRGRPGNVVRPRLRAAHCSLAISSEEDQEAAYVARVNLHSLLRYVDPLLGKKKWGRPLMQLLAGCVFFPSRVEQRLGEVASAGQEAEVEKRVTRGAVARIRWPAFSVQA